MRRVMLLVAILLLMAANAEAYMEGSGKVLFFQNQINFTQNGVNFNFQDDFGIPSKANVGEVEFAFFLGRDFRVKYAYLLPVKKEGTGSILNQVMLNQITFGPKDTKNAKPEPISAEFQTSSHRFEVDFLTRYSMLVTPSLFGEYRIGSLTLKGKPVTQGSSSTNATVDYQEASDSFRKFYVGVGASGRQRDRNVLMKYEVGYLTDGTKGGMFVDVNIRNDWPNCFLGAGYRYRQVDTGFAGGEWNEQDQGFFLEGGVAF